MATWVVAAYEVDRRYGGPEEGGWWYNDAALIRTLRVFKREDTAYNYCRRLNEKLSSKIWGPNQGRRDLYSVIGDPQIQAEVFADIAPKRYPENRPHYE